MAGGSPTRKRIRMAAGQRFGRLVAIRAVDRDRHGAIWRLRCDCGKTTVAYASNVTSGNTRSCGCWALEVKAATGRSTATHGMRNSPEYQAWIDMRRRCEHARRKSFPTYGGRGIKVCARWRQSFKSFLTDMGLRPSPKHSLDRYPDTNGDYEPTNCRWATAKQQTRNRRSNRIISYGGQNMTLAEAGERFGIRRDTIAARLKRGWSIERALSAPAAPPSLAPSPDRSARRRCN